MSDAARPQAQGKPPVSILAVLALALAFLCMPVGLVLAIIALVRINKSGGRLGGKTIAIVALVLNLVLVPTCGGIYAAIAIPNFIKFQCRSKQSEARSNLKALFVAEEMFKAEHQGYSPDLAAIGFSPMGERLRYDYVIVSADPQSFRAEARGKDDMAGDVWAITAANDLQSVQDKCGAGE